MEYALLLNKKTPKSDLAEITSLVKYLNRQDYTVRLCHFTKLKLDPEISISVYKESSCFKHIEMFRDLVDYKASHTERKRLLTQLHCVMGEDLKHPASFVFLATSETFPLDLCTSQNIPMFTWPADYKMLKSFLKSGV